MNRTYLQVIAMLMVTAAISFTAAEWRWEPANAGNYLVIVAPGSSSAADGMGSGRAQQERGTLAGQIRSNLH
ncbi:MAG TPA: hypothetical protein VF800_22565 [Telluria sp.]|jgi:hypothetical protein